MPLHQENTLQLNHTMCQNTVINKKRRTPFTRIQSGLKIVLAISCLFGFSMSSAYSQVAGSGWYTSGDVELVSPGLAEARIEENLAAQKAAMGDAVFAKSIAKAASATEITADIRELARGLQHDPLLIYQHVKNYIHYVPYFGYMKGATQTWLDRSGNDFDQASLLVALLRASGYSANYVYGTMTIPTQGGYEDRDLAHWFGVEADNTLVVEALAVGGIPASITGDSVEMRRVWVEVNVDGNVLQLDPAFKVSDQVDGELDLQAATGYDQTALGQAAGGSEGTHYVQSLSETGLNTALRDYTTNLISYIRQNHANASLEELLGTIRIRQVSLTALPSYPNFSFVKDATWTEIPQQYIHTINIQHGALNETLNAPDIAGKKLSISYLNVGTQKAAAFSKVSTSEVDTDLSTEFVLPDAETLAKTEQIIGNDVVADELSLTIEDEVQGEAADVEGADITPKLSATLSDNAFASSADSIAKAANGPCVSAGVRFLGQYVKLRCTYTNRLTRFGRGATITVRQIARSNTHRNRFVELSGFNVPFTLGYGQSRVFELLYKADQVGNPHEQAYQLAGSYVASGGGITARGGFTSAPFFYNGATVKYPNAQLSLDDRVIVTEGLAQPGVNINNLRLYVNHPYSAGNGNYADQVSNYPLKRGGNYVLLSGFGRDRSGKLLEKRQRLLQAYSDKEPDSSKKLLTEALNVLGQSWIRETGLSNQLLSRMSGIQHYFHHHFGIIAQEEGFYIDMRTKVGSSLRQKTETQDSHTLSAAYTRSTGFLNSALEHGVIEQLQDVKGVSTIRLLQLNNQNNKKLFRATQGNWNSIKSQLKGYTTARLNTLKTYLDQSGDVEIIVPERGDITLDKWKGLGYIGHVDNAAGGYTRQSMIISGDFTTQTASILPDQDHSETSPLLLASHIGMDSSHRLFYGGYPGSPGFISPIPINGNTSVSQNLPGELPTYTIADPVNTYTGDFLYDLPGIGFGDAPWGAALSASYTSADRYEQQGVGYGWKHSYQIAVAQYSDHRTGLGARNALDAAPSIVASYAILELMRQDERSAKEWGMGALIANWQMKQLDNQSYAVTFNDQRLTFTRMPDGSYIAPPGSTMTLSGSKGSFELKGRFGPTLAFDDQDRIETLTDTDGNTLTFTYSGDDLVAVEDTTDVGRTLSLSYVGSGDNKRVKRVTDHTGRYVEFTYDGALDVVQYRDVGGGIWQLTYQNHKLVSVTEPVGVVKVENTYDALHRVKTQKFPVQNKRVENQIYYSDYRTAEWNALGDQITYYFDDRGQQVRQINQLGHEIQMAYDGQNQLIRQTDAKGNTSTREYDQANNLIRATNALGETVTNSYDSQHRLIERQNPLGHRSTTTYDAKHHPLSSTVYPAAGKSITVRSTYQANGLLQDSIDARGTKSTTTYDQYGMPDKVQVEGYKAVDYDYDSLGRMISLTDQEGATTTFEYDDRGNVTKSTDPQGKVSTYRYDALGRLISMTDRNGDTSSIVYTDDGEIESVDYPGTKEDASFIYDERILVTEMTDSLGTTTFDYDKAYRLTNYTDANGFNLGYDYDANGNLTTLTYPDGKAITYGYDKLNRLKTVTNWLDETTTYQYDAAGRLIEKVNFNGTVSTNTYDDASRLLSHVDSKTDNEVITRQLLVLDDNGNRVKETKTQPQAPMETSGSESYTYNTQKTRLNRVVDSEVNTTTNFTYDNEGQLQSKNSDTFEFDSRHRLIKRVKDGVTTEYAYDANDNRLSVTKNGVITYYIYDSRNNLLAEADASKQITRHYIHGNGLLAMVQNNASYVYHFDVTGHTLAMTDDSQAVINKYAYSPYGRLLGETEAEGLEQPFKYVGTSGVQHEQDEIYYMRARYYDAETGRFLKEDPIGHEGGINLHLYAGGNPIAHTDPSGKAVPLVVWIILAGGGITTGVDGAIQYSQTQSIDLGRSATAFAAGTIGTAAGVGAGVAATAAGIGTVGSYVAGGAAAGFTSELTNQVVSGNRDISSLGVSTVVGGVAGPLARNIIPRNVGRPTALGSTAFGVNAANRLQQESVESLLGNSSSVINSFGGSSVSSGRSGG